MIDLLKAFGRGVLYVLALPFFLLALAIFAVIGLGDFTFQIIKSIIFFFTGQKFFPELPEDRELRLLRENAQPRAPMSDPFSREANQTPQGNYQQPIPPRREEQFVAPTPAPQPNSVEEACFKEEPEDDLISFINEEPKMEQVKREPVKPSYEEPKEEILEHYRPRETKFSGSYEDDADDNGVKIGFDD